MNQQPSNQHTHNRQASTRDGPHRGVQTYPIECTDGIGSYNPSSRTNPSAPGDPQYQWYQARGEPAVQIVPHSNYPTPQHYMSVDAHSRVEADGVLERVQWREEPSQTAGARYTQDSRATHFLSSPSTAVHSPRVHQQHASDWEPAGHGRRASEPVYDHRDAYQFSSPRESRRENVAPILPGGIGSPIDPDHERHGPSMVHRHPSLQSFGPYTTTVLHQGRNHSTGSSANDYPRSRPTSHTPYPTAQQPHTHQTLHNAETPQYVVPSSRIPRADSTVHASPTGYYNTTGAPNDSEDASETKPKRRRANAAQLKLLNDTYARTMFPTTEERADIARRINMTPRQVQIWFQNRRQASRQGQAGTPGSTLEGIYGEGNSDYLHEPEDD